MSDDIYKKLIDEEIKRCKMDIEAYKSNIKEFSEENEKTKEEYDRTKNRLSWIKTKYDEYDSAIKEEKAKLTSAKDRIRELERILYNAELLIQKDIK
ncbi:hypothetical protein [Paraclostridium sp. AKS81]|uniref:hypothetical protein n=1 Tax=Paraclostridium sp. AKS81 TaxID=2876117 RepID=UPI0021E0FB0F|nr:hypothetical protein [Paraclostridium sp. AKS81]MCU9811172.1 hypothetical protein [Paraclostridium sp. AKS81]